MITKEEMILELQEMFNTTGKVPTRNAFVECSKTKWGWLKHWPHWNAFVEEAGLKIIKKRNPKQIASKEELIEFFLEMQNRIGKQPTWAEFRSACPMAKISVEAHFGSFNRLIIEAGGTPRRMYNENHDPRKPWTRKEVLELAHKDIEEHDIQPTGYMFSRKHHIGYQFITDNFGTYEAMMESLIGKELTRQIVRTRRHRKVLKLKEPIIKQEWNKRYPVSYRATSVILKWCRHRYDNRTVVRYE